MHKLPKFRSIICATIAAGILFPGIASAADATWSGFYGGLALGGTYGQSKPDTTGELSDYFTGDDPEVLKPFLQKTISGSALTGSVLAGYERTRGQMVYGIETDISVMNYSETSAAGPVTYNTNTGIDFNINSTLETNFAFSIRPKIGYAVGNWMFHAAAGPSIGYFDYDFRYTDTNAGAANDFSKSTLALGISSGLGSSYKLDNGWVLRGDYVMNYYPKVIDERQSFVRSGFQGSFDHQVDFQSHNLRFAVIKRF